VGADQRELRRLLSGSRLIEPAAKRHWLRVLPVLTPADRDRLAQILLAEAGLDPGKGPCSVAEIGRIVPSP